MAALTGLTVNGEATIEATELAGDTGGTHDKGVVPLSACRASKRSTLETLVFMVNLPRGCAWN